MELAKGKVFLLLALFLCFSSGQESRNAACSFEVTAQGYTCILPSNSLIGALRLNITAQNHQQNRNNSDVIGFQLINTNINFFPRNAFELFSNLENILFIGNNLPALEANVFSSRFLIRSLTLNGNNIQTIQPGAFAGLTLLEKLYLQQNSISSLPQNIFAMLLSLRSLNLGLNSIVQLESNVFLNNHQLRQINLSFNRISRIPRNAFETITNLETLLMRSNQCIDEDFLNINDGDLTNISPRLSRCFGLSPVTCLFTNNTQILGISDFDYTCTIEGATLERNQRLVSFGGAHIANMNNDNVVNLRVNYSKIPFIMTEMFTTFRRLKAIEITNGGLVEIRANDFLNAEGLESLYMQYNNINVLSGGIFANLPRLQKLSLAKNEIEVVDGNAFSGLVSLRLLYLHDNRIRRLHQNSFNSLVELRDLNLARNYLTSISSLLFFHNPQTGVIMLDSNQISAIDERILENLPRLAVFNLLSNRCVNSLFDGNRNRINEELADCYEAYRGLPVEGTRQVILEIDGAVGLINEDGERIEL